MREEKFTIHGIVTYEDGTKEKISIEATSLTNAFSVFSSFKKQIEFNSLTSKFTIAFETIDTSILKGVSQQGVAFAVGDDINIISEYRLGFIYSWGFSLKGIKSNKVYETPELAFIGALCEKYLGKDEKLSSYIIKILNISSVWGS